MTDADDITTLDEATVHKIAAGEVVERPASVVKELVENSLDADAGRVEVTVERGGKDLVRVKDDGVGMTEEAVKKAVRQHTTSKIEDVYDLDSGVSTLGFRGEALHTIGAVSKLTIRTKPRGAEVGTELRMEGGSVVSVERTGCPEGTVVEVTGLFYNTPAREKYLKQDRTEFTRVNDVVTNYALAYPEVAVTLSHDGREVFSTTGQGDLQATIMAVYGREVARKMIPVDVDSTGNEGVEGENADDEASSDDETADDETADDDTTEPPLTSVEGYVSHPETTRSSREYVSAFVNGRYVQSTAAREAVVEAYGDQLAPDRYPFAVLFLEIPPGEVDVNVHPRKLEVRFAEEEALREQVREAVKDALLDHGLLRTRAPRGRSAPEETEIAPERSDRVDRSPSHTDAHTGNRSPTESTAGSPTESTAGSPTESTAGSPTESTADTGTSSAASNTESRVRSGTTTDSSSTPGSNPDSAPETADSDAETADSDAETAEISATDQPATEPPTSDAPTTVDDPARKFGGTEQRTLTDEPVSVDREFETLPPLRVLGQYDDTYVVADGPDGLVVIDQHAADERINYERLRERVREDGTTQTLADPVEVELTAGEAAVLDTCREALEAVGFRAERADDRTVAVTAVPAVVADALEPDRLQDLLTETLRADDPDRPVEARTDDLLADLACHPSITGGTSLTEGSVFELLRKLDDCENPWACPHGRPVLVEFGDDELEARFERDYPGH